MARLICVMGESGSGKTTSLRNLDPERTYIVDCDKKGLSWRGWRRQYNAEAKNYFVTDSTDRLLERERFLPSGGKETVPGLLDRIDAGETSHPIDVLVVDTLNGIMVADEARRRGEDGYDKWADLAFAVWGLIDRASRMRDGLTVVFLAHSQTDRDEFGFVQTRIKTSGKKLDKIVLESKFPTVLYATRMDGRHVFVSRAEHNTAKAPMGALPEVMDNDIAEVIRLLDEYENYEESEE